MRLTSTLLPLALATVLLAGCTGRSDAPTPDATGQAPAPGQGRPATQPKPTPSPTTQGVRKVSLADREWVDVLRDGAKVTLQQGRARDGEFAYQLSDDLTYSDADGDGHEDVLALLRRTKGDAVVTYGYIWRYDPATRQVAQVPDPVGDWNTCGDKLISVEKGDPNGFMIDEKLRDHYDFQKCGTDPLHRRQRTVAVTGGALVMTKPFLAYGGICYHTFDSATELTRAVPIRLGPEAAAPVVASSKVVYNTIPAKVERTWPEGWTQVGWLTEEMRKADAHWGICGFIWAK